MSLKYQSLVTCIYDHLDVEELKQLRLTVEEAKITDLDFSRHVRNVEKHAIKKRILFNIVLVTFEFTTMLAVISMENVVPVVIKLRC